MAAKLKEEMLYTSPTCLFKGHIECFSTDCKHCNVMAMNLDNHQQDMLNAQNTINDLKDLVHRLLKIIEKD